MKLLALMKKEFVRFFRDPRLIFAMIAPGLLIFMIYSIMGSVMNAETQNTFDYDFKVYIEETSQIVSVLEGSVKEAGGTLTLTPAESEESAKKEVEEGKADAFLVFSPNFDEAVASYEVGSGVKAPSVEIYYRSGDEASSAFYALTTSVLEAYEASISNKFDVNAGTGYDFSPAGEFVTQLMAGLFPFLIVIFVFSACMTVTLESVAGEKERGTLATILVTSVPRYQIALGKILPLGCVSLIGAVSSFLGVMLSMPRLMGVSIGAMFAGVGAAGYLLLFLLILSVVPLIVALISIVSTVARSVKEASAYTSVIMIITMVLSLLSAFVAGIGSWSVAVPILNAVVCMQGAFTGSYVVWQCLVSVLMNFAYTALIVFLISRMLSSERFMFGK